MKIIGDCPLGSKCEEIRDGELHKCNWLVHIAGKDPQSHKQMDESRCAMAWVPILLVENARTNRGQTQAIEMLRNIVAEGNQVVNLAAQTAISQNSTRRLE